MSSTRTRRADGGFDTKEFVERLEEGWIPLQVVFGGPSNVICNSVPRLSLASASIEKAVTAAEEADLNRGRANSDASPPVIIPLVRRGGRMPLVAITSLPFHAMSDKAGKEIPLDKSDLAVAQTSASEYTCANIRAPDPKCKVVDFAERRTELNEISGFFARIANGLDRAFTLPKNKKGDKL